LEGDHAEAEPEGAVVGGKWDQGCAPPEVGEGVDDRGEDVQGEEDERHQGEVAMQARREEARPAPGLHTQGGQDAEDDDCAEQDDAGDGGEGGCVGQAVEEAEGGVSGAGAVVRDHGAKLAAGASGAPQRSLGDFCEALTRTGTREWGWGWASELTPR